MEPTQNTALLVMDMQTGVLTNFPGVETLVNNVAKAISHARDKKIPVIYVTVGFRPGGPEISLNNKMFAASKERMANVSANVNDFMKVYPGLTPLNDDIIVVKRRVSAFTGSDLEVVLRSQSVQHLILTGFATSGVVLSTLREAADKDYRLTVIADCCGDRDEEVHNVLTGKVFSRQADVFSLEEWSKL
jgi:nicotinamidase-related amidase